MSRHAILLVLGLIFILRPAAHSAGAQTPSPTVSPSPGPVVIETAFPTGTPVETPQPTPTVTPTPTSTPVPTPTPIPPRKVVVFISGIGTSLSTQQAASGPCAPPNASDWGQVKTALRTRDGFTCGEFLRYSYNGGAVTGSGVWRPNRYGCPSTGNPIAQSTRILVTMLRAYRQAHPSIQFVLIGHSLGGVVAMEGARAAIAGGQLPPHSIAAVVTVDSPLKHASHHNLLLFTRLAREYLLDWVCQGEVLIDSAAAHDTGNVTGASSRQMYSDRAEAFVTNAEATGTRFMTVGNRQDCVWYPTLCRLKGSWDDDRPSMLVRAASVHKLYNLGTQNCNLAGHAFGILLPTDFLCVTDPHGVALTTPAVTQDIATFVGHHAGP